MPTVHLLIKGKVQGVYFRVSAKEMAETLDVKGWVRNTPDGSVELLASGGEAALQQFIEWCKKGPDGAQVTTVNVTAFSEQNFDVFRIRR